MESVYGMHNMPGLPTGHFAVRKGTIMTSEDVFVITIQGRGGHASMPERTVDPVVVGAKIVLALQTIVSRSLSPRDWGVVSVTEFTTDGARNVIPSEVVIKGDCRALSVETQRTIETRMREIVGGLSAAYGAEGHVEYREDFIPTVNAPAETEAAILAARQVAGEVAVDPDCLRSYAPAETRLLHSDRQRRGWPLRSLAAQPELRPERRHSGYRLPLLGDLGRAATGGESRLMYSRRMNELRRSLEEHDLDGAIITDDDNVYYLTGYYDYLHMEFGRPTILIVPRDGESLLITPSMEMGESLLITPSMEMDMAEAAARVDRIVAWNDGLGNEWREEVPAAVSGMARVGIEPDTMPPVVRKYVGTLFDESRIGDVAPILATMRMIKSDEELQLARHAGEVAMEMMDAARATIGDGVAEFEVALATSQAGTRKAAELLAAHHDDGCMSPNTHFLQIMASGREITKPHHRASTRIMRRGEPVFMCFCGMTNFHRFKLGFDRTFWIGDIADPKQAEVYQVAVASQTAALAALRPGVTAESVHAAYAEVIEEAVRPGDGL
jgi:Xaa-Pro aminopeptidase